MTTTELLFDYEIMDQTESQTNNYIKDLFDDEGAFGEADCAGL